MMNNDVGEQVRLSFLACCFAGCALLSVHVVAPGNPVYIILTVALTLLSVVAFLWSEKAPERALQVFCWVMLIVVAGMVTMDMQSHASDGLPVVIVAPTIATVLLRLWAGVKASALYGVGVGALLVSTAVTYDGWVQVGLLLFLVAVATMARPLSPVVVAAMAHLRRPTSDDLALLEAVNGMERTAKAVNYETRARD